MTCDRASILDHTEADLNGYLNLLRGYFLMSQSAIASLAPAVVETPLFEPLLTPEQLAAFNAFHPLVRNGQAKHITEAVLFLADDSCSSWITGVVLPIDGGVTAGRN